MTDRCGRMIAAALVVVAGAILAIGARAEHFFFGGCLVVIGGLALTYDWMASRRNSRP